MMVLKWIYVKLSFSFSLSNALSWQKIMTCGHPGGGRWICDPRPYYHLDRDVRAIVCRTETVRVPLKVVVGSQHSDDDNGGRPVRGYRHCEALPTAFLYMWSLTAAAIRQYGDKMSGRVAAGVHVRPMYLCPPLRKFI